MSEFLIATAIGAGSAAALLALFVRLPAKQLADLGFLSLVAMISIYIGARLVAGDIAGIAIETAIASAAIIAARFAMTRWLPAIGIAILMHGAYDALIGPHTGVADWYPPLCAGFDLVTGIGLTLILSRRQSS